MVKVKEIVVVRREGPSSLCGIENKFSSLEAADKFFLDNASNYPSMGYDKHDVKIEWEDGQSFDFRMDVHGLGNQFYRGDCVSQELESMIVYYNGRAAHHQPDEQQRLSDPAWYGFMAELDSGKYEVKVAA